MTAPALVQLTKTVMAVMVCGGPKLGSHPARHRLQFASLLKTQDLQVRSSLLSEVPCGAQNAIESRLLRQSGGGAATMTQHKDHGLTEEIVLPEHLLPLGSVLGEGVSALDLCTVLAKIFRVQYTEVALLRLEGGLLHFVFPEYLRTSGAIPVSSKAVAGHTALSKKAEIFNNFARVKHASIFDTIKSVGSDVGAPASATPIQKLMSVPILDHQLAVIGVIQISRKGLDPRHAQDFSREDLHDLELAAGLLATS